MNERADFLRRLLRDTTNQHAADYGLDGKEVLNAVLGHLGETVVSFCEQTSLSPGDRERLRRWMVTSLEKLPLGGEENGSE